MTTGTHGARRMPRAVLALATAATAGAILAACTTPPTATPTAEPTTPTISRPDAPEGELPAELASELQQTLEDTMAEYNVPGAAAGVWIPDEGTWTSVIRIADLEATRRRPCHAVAHAQHHEVLHRDSDPAARR